MSTYTPKRSRRGLRLVVALALATTAAGGVFVYASSVQRQAAQQQQQIRQEASADPTQTPLVSVVVAHVDLQAKTRLTPDAFELRELPVVAVFKKDTLGKDQSMIMLQDVLVLAVAQATSADQLLAVPTAAPAAANARPAAPAPAAGLNTTTRPTPAPAATPLPAPGQVFN